MTDNDDKITVTTTIYNSDDCNYCNIGFKENDAIEFEGYYPVHQSCMLKEEENEIKNGQAKRCYVCKELIVKYNEGDTFDSNLRDDGNYVHPGC